MANLYLTEQGSVLRKTGERLIVEKDGETLLDVQSSKISAVLIFGNVQVTTQAVHELLKCGIELALLSRSGKLLGQLTSPFTKNIELRVEQFKRQGDEAFKLDLARAIVRGKITNCLAVMTAFSYNHQDIDLGRERSGLEESIKTIDGVSTLASMRGVEGTAARIYFEGYGKMILGDFPFEGRRKHPSTDPVNALLSFGYTMIFNEISSLLDGLGFDPYLGYLHEVDYGRASLACDIQEEFRAIIDRFTLYLVNNRMLVENDFYENPKDGSVYMTRDAMKGYFAEYEKYLTREFSHCDTGECTTLRKCFRIQAERLAGFIGGSPQYLPFRLVE